MLKRSIYVLVSPIFMIFAILACAGTPLLDIPTFTCPTVVPAAPLPTVLPGTATPIPVPTQIPSTPYIITAPQDFYVDDAVFVGNATSPLRVRFRLQNIQTYPATPAIDGTPRQIVSWQLHVKNVGTQDYEIFPALQMLVSEIETAYGTVTGTWGSTQAAGDDIGLTVDNDIYTLTPNQTRTFRFGAFAPAGTVSRFGFSLDPTTTDNQSVISWSNQSNPYC